MDETRRVFHPGGGGRGRWGPGHRDALLLIPSPLLPCMNAAAYFARFVLICHVALNLMHGLVVPGGWRMCLWRPVTAALPPSAIDGAGGAGCRWLSWLAWRLPPSHSLEGP